MDSAKHRTLVAPGYSPWCSLQFTYPLHMAALFSLKSHLPRASYNQRWGEVLRNMPKLSQSSQLGVLATDWKLETRQLYLGGRQKSLQSKTRLKGAQNTVDRREYNQNTNWCEALSVFLFLLQLWLSLLEKKDWRRNFDLSTWPKAFRSTSVATGFAGVELLLEDDDNGVMRAHRAEVMMVNLPVRRMKLVKGSLAQDAGEEDEMGES